MLRGVLKVAIVLSIFCLFTTANAQWKQTNGPYGGVVLALASWGDRVVAGSSGEVLLSIDSGTSWSKITGDLPSGLTIRSVAINDKNIFVGTTNSLYISSNGGMSWTKASSAGFYINDLFLRGEVIYSGSSNRVYFSKDNGVNWTACQASISGILNTLYADSSTIFAGTSEGVFISRDSGTTWTAANTGLTNRYVLDFITIGNNLIAATSGGPYISSDHEASWKRIRSGLTDTITTSLAVIGSTLITGTTSGTYISSDTGANWTAAKSGLKNPYVYKLVQSGNRILAGTQGGVFATSDGISWSEENKGFLNTTVTSLVSKGDSIFAGASGGVFLSTDKGDSWTNVSSELFSGSITCLAPGVGDDIWAGTDGGKVFVSSDYGKSWKEFKPGLPSGYSISCISVKNDYVFAGTSGRGVYLANTNQISWGDVNVNIADNAYVSCLLATPSWEYCFTDGGFFRLMISYQSWYSIRSGGNSVKCFHRNSSGAIFAGSRGRGLLQYLDTLTQMNTGIPQNSSVTALAGYNNYMLAGTDSSIYISSNNGSAWIPFDSGFGQSAVRSLAITNDYMAFAGVTAGGVWRRSISGYVGVNKEKKDLTLNEGFKVQAQRSCSDINIEFSLNSAETVKLIICDLSGRNRATLISNRLLPGVHKFKWNTESVKPGIYMVKLLSGKKNDHKLVTVIN